MSFINLRNERYFPLARNIPHHSDTTTDLFIPSPNTIITLHEKPKIVPEPPARRLRHWCTIAGLNFGNSMVGVHDMRRGEMDFGLREAGRDMELIHLRSNGLLDDPNGGRAMVDALRMLAMKGSVAVMYTVNIIGDDAYPAENPMTVLHIPNTASTRGFKCGIDRLFEINDAFHARVKAGKLGHCQRCSLPAANRCVGCKSAYCEADCQKRDWMRHKDECQVITQIRDWSTFDWDVYEEPYVFKRGGKAAKEPASSS